MVQVILSTVGARHRAFPRVLAMVRRWRLPPSRTESDAMRATITDHRSDVAILRLSGELDADTATHLQCVLADLVERPVPRIVVDLSDLKFCDSVGLSAFVTCKQVIGERGGWMSFAGANPFLSQLMETVGLSRYFAIFPEVDDAIAAGRV
jgi:anti-sigma B factor antagonist